MKEKRTLQVSKIAALLERQGIKISDSLPENERPHFIPSACWRNIAPGILSTTRFTGMLLAYGKKYAVYDIGDGNMEWQVRAESSLFYTKYGSYETKADGMILENDNEINLSNLKKAYEQTLRIRSQLISVVYDIEQYIEPRKSQASEQVVNNNKEIVTLTINEPLPAQKELTAAVEEHWITMIHSAIAEESKTGIPNFKKAMVAIYITSPRETNNRLVWDVSNRVINVVINNLKGIFFKDDDFKNIIEKS